MYHQNSNSSSSASDRGSGSSGSGCSSRSGSNSNSPTCNSPNSLLIRRRRLQISAKAYLGPAFSAAINAPPPSDALDADRNFPRYTRVRLPPPPSDSYLFTPADSGPIRNLRGVPSLASISSPLSPIENRLTPPARSPSVYKMPVEPMGEDVLVMDGILVGASLGGARGRPVDSDAASVGGSYRVYKSEVCRSWEDFGSCRFASKCQFAHGKEELRPARQPSYKTEEASIRPDNYQSQRREGLNITTTSASPNASWTLDSVRRSQAGWTVRSSTFGIKNKAGQVGEMSGERVQAAAATTVDWENVEPEEMALSTKSTLVSLFKLYGPRRRRRLPVFEEFCPE